MDDIVVQKIVRPERVVAGPWLEVIASNLDYHRATFLWKCEGLSEAQLRQRPVQSSALTLLGLMRHLQGVERAWFQRTLAATTPQFFPYQTYVNVAGDEWYDESDPTCGRGRLRGLSEGVRGVAAGVRTGDRRSCTPRAEPGIRRRRCPVRP